MSGIYSSLCQRPRSEIDIVFVKDPVLVLFEKMEHKKGLLKALVSIYIVVPSSISIMILNIYIVCIAWTRIDMAVEKIKWIS